MTKFLIGLLMLCVFTVLAPWVGCATPKKAAQPTIVPVAEEKAPPPEKHAVESPIHLGGSSSGRGR